MAKKSLFMQDVPKRSRPPKKNPRTSFKFKVFKMLFKLIEMLWMIVQIVQCFIEFFRK